LNLQQIINDNPFLEETGVDADRLFLTSLSNTPNELGLSQIKEMQVELEKYVIMRKEVYLYCPRGYGRTKFSNDFFERKLRITATIVNRNMA
jgi:hypothetical protein